MAGADSNGMQFVPCSVRIRLMSLLGPQMEVLTDTVSDKHYKKIQNVV